MEGLIELSLQIGVVVFLLFLGFFFGGMAERNHFKSLEEREAANRDFLVTQIRTFPDCDHRGQPPVLICGEAVIASDFLKTFLSKLRKIFGGELRSYLPLIERARREALLRVIEQARRQGYDAICNLRFDSSDISGATKSRKTSDMVAIMASATAYCRLKSTP